MGTLKTILKRSKVFKGESSAQMYLCSFILLQSTESVEKPLIVYTSVLAMFPLPLLWWGNLSLEKGRAVDMLISPSLLTPVGC